MAHPLSRELCQLRAGQKLTAVSEEYEVGGKIGDGAIGIVRKLVRVSAGPPITRAIKVLAPDPKYIEESVFDDVAARFKREGERGSQLDFPFLLKVHRFNANEDGAAFENRMPKNPFLIMEFVRGETLESY